VVFTQAIKHYTLSQSQQWRFEYMGEFLLKSHCSAKMPDPNRVCKRTFIVYIGVEFGSFTLANARDIANVNTA